MTDEFHNVLVSQLGKDIDEEEYSDEILDDDFEDIEDDDEDFDEDDNEDFDDEEM